MVLEISVGYQSRENKKDFPECSRQEKKEEHMDFSLKEKTAIVKFLRK